MTLELPIVVGEDALPVPTSRRYMPLRSAVQNLWYHDAILEYCDGKMLNRGHNGSGKSIFLGLQWPFLLSGRVKDAVPPGTRGHMEDVRSVMLAFGHYGSRLGYTWIECGRIGDAGPEYRTLGAGLSASTGSTVVHWHFITDGRVGRDFHLFDAVGNPLERAGLAAVIGRDHVFSGDDLSAYRAAVDRELFGLGPERYDQLVSVLRALSKPTLGAALTPEQAGQHVRDFLPALPSELFEAIANHFSRTDGLHDRVQQMEETVEAMDAVLEAHRNYSREVLRRLGADLRKADSDYEEARSQSRRLSARREEANAAVGQARAEVDATGRTLTAIQERVQALETSDAVTAAREVKAAGEQETLATRHHEQAAVDRKRTQQEVDRAQGRLDDASAEAATAAEAVRTAGEAAHGLAPQAVFDDLHSMLVSLISGGELVRAQRRLEDDMGRRRTTVQQLHRLSGTVTDRRQELTAAEGRLDDAQGHLDGSVAARSAAAAAVNQAQSGLIAAVAEWRTTCRELHVTPDETALIEGGVATRESLHQVTSRVAAPRRVELTAGQAARAAEAHRAEGVIAELREEHARVASEREDGPPLNVTRLRPSDRPGAPFWKVVAFQSDVEPNVAAAVEASLQAAGLLDAWITPDGTLLSTHELDAAVIPGGAVDGASLVDVLTPDGGDVAHDVVHRLLASIARDQADVVSIGSDGSYVLGPLHGRWHKDEPEHIGAAARERARKRRLAHLDGRIAETEQERDKARADEAAFRDRLVALEEDLNRLPDDSPLHRADAALAAAEHAVVACEQAVEHARSAAEAARRALEDARDALVHRGLETGLSAWVDDLGRLEDNTNLYREAASAWFLLTDLFAQRQQRVTELQDDLASKAHELALREQREAETGEDLARASSRHQALRDRAGSDADKALADLAIAKEQHRRARAEAQVAGDRRIAAERTQAEIAARVDAMAATVNQAAATRDTAADAMRAAIQQGLLTTAWWETLTDDTDHEEPGVRRLRDLARLPQLMPVPGREPEPRPGNTLEAWNTNAARLTDYDVHLDGSMAGVFALHIPHGSYKSETVEVAAGLLRDVRARVAADAEETRALISREELEFFDGVILDEAARRLNEALGSATDHLTRINALLARHPTRAGHLVRVAWRLRPPPHAPEGTREVTELVAQRADLLPEDRRAVLRRWLQQRVEDARQDQDGPFVDRLARAFNYTTWYRADVEVRMPDRETWDRFESGRIPLSAGERATLLYLPLFAAVATAYSGAKADAPRLFALDEAFERIDDTMRESIFDMIGDLDLDLLMANFSLKPLYDTIRGIAINIMTRRQDGPGVGVTSSYWNGSTLVEDL